MTNETYYEIQNKQDQIREEEFRQELLPPFMRDYSRLNRLKAERDNIYMEKVYSSYQTEAWADKIRRARGLGPLPKY